MHATLHQLLILRDQVIPDSAVAAHVHECVECRTELTRLQAVTTGLRNLPARWSPPDRWPAIQQALLHQRSGRAPERERRRPGWLVPAASAAAVVLAVTVTLDVQRQREPKQTNVSAEETDRQVRRGVETNSTPVTGGQTTNVKTDPVQASLQADPQITKDPEVLIAESQRLEQMLTILPEEPRVTRAATALTVADLEDRIQWVDYRLNMGAESGIEPRQSHSLWQERVDLLNSLVAVRYAQSNALAF